MTRYKHENKKIKIMYPFIMILILFIVFSSVSHEINLNSTDDSFSFLTLSLEEQKFSRTELINNKISMKMFSVPLISFLENLKYSLVYDFLDLNKFKSIIYNNDIWDTFLTLLLSISMGTLSIYFIWSGILVLFPMKKIKASYKNIENYQLYVMVPSLNEKYVVENTIHRFFKKSNERHKLVVIDDGSDDGTGDILEKIATKYENLHIITRTFPNARKGKGEALNEGFRYIKKIENTNSENVIIGVIDADAYIKNSDYTKILSVFNGNTDLAMVQTAVGMNAINSWLHRMQDIEFQSCITLISNVRNYLGNAAGGGNGQFFRLSTFKNKEEVWGNSLLEDFELSTRILLEGKETYFLENIVVYQEPVGKIKPFIIQRTRWAQGGIECIFKYGKPILQSTYIKNMAKFEMFFYMVLPLITSIGVVGHITAIVYNAYLFFILKAPVSLELTMLFTISIIISLVFGAIYGSRVKYGVLKGLLIGSTIPFYAAIAIPVCYRSIIRFVAGKRKWEKTEHIIKVET